MLNNSNRLDIPIKSKKMKGAIAKFPPDVANREKIGEIINEKQTEKSAITVTFFNYTNNFVDANCISLQYI